MNRSENRKEQPKKTRQDTGDGTISGDVRRTKLAVKARDIASLMTIVVTLLWKRWHTVMITNYCDKINDNNISFCVPSDSKAF